MSYRLNKTNGDLLVELVDGQIDITSTDITLVGRNYKGFGEFLNENYIKILENFAKTNAPSQPLTGQLWYDTAEERLKVFTGDTFKPAGGPIISNSQPNLVAGDLWIDSENNKLYFYDGADVVMVGPNYDAGQGKTGLEAVTVVDNNDKAQVVLFMYMGNSLVGIWSRNQFRPSVTISGFPLDPDDTQIPRRQLIKPGFNPVNDNFWYRGTVQATSSLIDTNTLEEFTPAKFLKTDRSSTTSGNLKVRNPGGLTVGVNDADYAAFRVVGTTTWIETQRADRDFGIRTTRGQNYENAFYVDASEAKVGIWNINPTVELDVTGSGRYTGDLTVQGNLTVQGDTTQINVATLQVEDKNIELAITSGSPNGGDTEADGAGIIVGSTDGNKTITWENSTGNWTFNQDLDLSSGKAYKINDTTVLSADRLHDGIVYAEGLTSLGQLTHLEVDTFSFDGNTLTTSGALNITAGDLITVNSRKITGVATPSDTDNDSYVATKGYVDTIVESRDIAVTLDTTSFTSPSSVFTDGFGPHQDVLPLLEFLHPVDDGQGNTLIRNGTVARILCTSYTQATVTNIDVDKLIDDPNNPGGPQISAAEISTVSVLSNVGTPNQYESVVSDIEFLPVSADAELTPERGKMIFEVVAGAWVWQSTTAIT